MTRSIMVTALKSNSHTGNRLGLGTANSGFGQANVEDTQYYPGNIDF